MKFFYLIFILGLFVISSCKKEEVAAPSLAPEIQFLKINPTEVKEYSDKIVFSIMYSDPDGDLGENDPAVSNLFLTDNRNQVTYKYRIQQLAPDNANVRISGGLTVELKNTAITDNTTSQSTSYNIYVTDRAGNTSNVITTSSITITK